MFKRLKLLHWSSRKLRLPIYGTGLNLDVGSGGNPHPFADVLLEKYIDDTHRLKEIVIDRPIIMADAASMPFRDNAFQYIFAFHVLEHLHNPASFLDELQRIGKAGYIETPNAIYERITPFDVHLLELIQIGDTLHIYKKADAGGSDFISHSNLLENDKNWKIFFSSNPKYFHNCYKWSGNIKYKIINPETNTDWFEDPTTTNPIDEKIGKYTNSQGSIRDRIVNVIKNYNRGRKKFNLEDILACPACKGALATQNEVYRCKSKTCGNEYVRYPFPDFNQPAN